MLQVHPQGSASFLTAPSLGKIFRDEWRWWLLGGLVSCLLAAVLLSGLRHAWSGMAYPYAYELDTKGHLLVMQRALEGWTYSNPRSGYPFGSDSLDYPVPDSGSLLIIKSIGLFVSGVIAVSNTYVLLGFFAVFLSSYLVFRSLAFARPLSAFGALAFNFLPYHFFRIYGGHLFLTWYFVVPIFFYLAFCIFYDRKLFLSRSKIARFFGLLALYAVLSSFGIYYALFGMILLASVGVLASFHEASLRGIRSAGLALMLVFIGVLLNVVPSLLNRLFNGQNGEAVTRYPVDWDTYGFKLSQLFLPRPDHRITALANISASYSVDFRQFVEETAYCSLGVVGALGLLFLAVCVFVSPAVRKLEGRLIVFSSTALVLLVFGLQGGLGRLVSQLLLHDIRGWNRISIFLAFAALGASLWGIQYLLERVFNGKSRLLYGWVMGGVALGLSGVALYDQTAPVSLEKRRLYAASYDADKTFVQAIESRLPQGSAVYQLPYMAFPEPPEKYALSFYDQAVGFLYSKDLRWSYGGIKGRPGDLFFRALSAEPAATQVRVLRRLGFSGVYIDLRGYQDGGAQVVQAFSAILGQPTLRRADGRGVFFPITASEPMVAAGATPAELMQKAEFDALGTRYPASLSEGIDFARGDWPSFIRDVTGLADAEPGGRWSDANRSPRVRFTFSQPLPERFTLVLQARFFGPNLGQPLLVKVGSRRFTLTPDVERMRLELPVDTGGEQADFIEFVPPCPTAPGQLGVGQDSRRLGIFFEHLAVVP